MARCDECLWRDASGKCHNVANQDYGKTVSADGWCSMHPDAVRYETAEFRSTQVPDGWEPFAVGHGGGGRWGWNVMCRRPVSP